MNNLDVVDIYDENKNKTGKVKIRHTDGEAIAVRWVDIDEFIEMFNKGDIVYNVDFDRKDYEKCLKYLSF